MQPGPLISRLRRFTGLAAVCLALKMQTATAVIYTWTGAGLLGNQDFLWSNNFNWAGNVAPSPGEANVSLVFADGYPKATTNDIAGLVVAAIQFQGSNYVVQGKPSGNTLTFYGTGLGGRPYRDG